MKKKTDKILFLWKTNEDKANTKSHWLQQDKFLKPIGLPTQYLHLTRIRLYQYFSHKTFIKSSLYLILAYIVYTSFPNYFLKHNNSLFFYVILHISSCSCSPDNVRLRLTALNYHKVSFNNVVIFCQSVQCHTLSLCTWHEAFKRCNVMCIWTIIWTTCVWILDFAFVELDIPSYERTTYVCAMINRQLIGSIEHQGSFNQLFSVLTAVPNLHQPIAPIAPFRHVAPLIATLRYHINFTNFASEMRAFYVHV